MTLHVRTFPLHMLHAHVYLYICANVDVNKPVYLIYLIFVTKIEKKTDYFIIQMCEWFELKQFYEFFLAWGMFEIK